MGCSCARGTGNVTERVAQCVDIPVCACARRYGLPTSSSQCITGAVIGVGICENINGKGVNWRQFLRQFASWVATLFLVGFGTAALFAQVISSSMCSTCMID